MIVYCVRTSCCCSEGFSRSSRLDLWDLTCLSPLRTCQWSIHVARQCHIIAHYVWIPMDWSCDWGSCDSFSFKMMMVFFCRWENFIAILKIWLLFSHFLWTPWEKRWNRFTIQGVHCGAQLDIDSQGAPGDILGSWEIHYGNEHPINDTKNQENNWDGQSKGGLGLVWRVMNCDEAIFCLVIILWYFILCPKQLGMERSWRKWCPSEVAHRQGNSL